MINDDRNVTSKTEYDEIFSLMIALLCNVKLPELSELEEGIVSNEKFQEIYNIVNDLRDLTIALNKGDLQKLVYGKGFLLSNLKSLQANLRHLTWQVQKISEGDFSQQVEFLGDFSKAFNKMASRLRENNIKLTKLANFDSLTQIPNRFSLDMFSESSFVTNSQICALVIDIDWFKKVNDNYGHDVGDLVLIHISNILKSQFRNSDFLARYGGEEFVAVLPDTDIVTAEKIAMRAIRAVRHSPYILGDGTEVYVTISIGISNKIIDDTSFKDIFKRSDKALYEAKNKGRDCFCIL